METQSKLLEEQYISTRLQEFKEIKRKEISFTINKSNVENSVSTYVHFCTNHDGNWVGCTTLRISDHLHHDKNLKEKQFIIEPSAILTKKKKELFMRTLEQTLKTTLKKQVFSKLNKLSREIEK